MTKEHVCRYLELLPDGNYFCGGCLKTYRLVPAVEPESAPKLPASIRRDVERAIDQALHPKGMSTHDGKAVIGVDRLQYLMRLIDGAPDEPAADLAVLAREVFAADDAYGCGFYNNERWRAAYDALRSAVNRGASHE